MSFFAVLLLLFRPMLVTTIDPLLHHSEDDAVLSINQVVPLHYIFSVGIADRYYYLAKKIDKGRYELLYVDPYHKLKVCQSVSTTGFDEQLEPDISIGFISSITQSENDLYVKVVVSYDNPCVG